VLQGNLFEKKSLKELLDPEPPDKKTEPQMRLCL
jgi:hypothetical protein